jgi:hypothetical protein
MELDQARANVAEAIAEPSANDLARSLEKIEWTAARCVEAVRAAAREKSLGPLQPLFDNTAKAGIAAEGGAVERLCLLRTIAGTLDGRSSLSPIPAIQKFTLNEFQYVVKPDSATLKFLQARGSALLTLAKIASAERYPAGSFHCEFSAIPRSYLLRSRPFSAWPRLVAVMLRVRGLAPCFEVHTNPRIRLLRMEDGMKSYHRIAKLMELHPKVRALVAFSWLRSPENHKVSPHLRWINEVVVQNGGVETIIGEAAKNSGVFARSQARTEQFEKGSFQPTMGLVIWPREDVIRWANAFSAEPL